MLDVVDPLLAGEFQVVDLACGPGSLSMRLLERFPRASCLAIDLDPVLLAIGRGALGNMPVLGDLFIERDRRFAWREDTWADPGYDFQKAALLESGFREVGSIWQNMDNRVLMAIR